MKMMNRERMWQLAVDAKSYSCLFWVWLWDAQMTENNLPVKYRRPIQIPPHCQRRSAPERKNQQGR